jgi:hypothetical protein
MEQARCCCKDTVWSAAALRVDGLTAPYVVDAARAAVGVT